jgi:hypothetical protein
MIPAVEVLATWRDKEVDVGQPGPADCLSVHSLPR